MARSATVAETRDRILDAVIALITEEHPATVSVPAVARRAHVSVATVYRYFPTKELLLDAATEVGHQRTTAALESGALGPPRPGEGTLDPHRIDAVIAHFFGELAEHLDYVREAAASPAGRDLRRRRQPGKRRQYEALLVGLGIDPATPTGRRLATSIELLVSSTVFLELHDHLGLSPADAAAHVAWSIRTLVEASR